MPQIDPRKGSWYQLKDYISLWFYVLEVPEVVNPKNPGFTYLRLSTRYMLTPPTGATISHQIAQQFRKNSGWTAEAQSQWVSHAVNPSYFKYLTRETVTFSSPGWYIYKFAGADINFGLIDYCTVPFDSVMWIKDGAGKFYRTNYQIYQGRYAKPYMTGGTPGNSVRKEATSTEYGVTNAGSCYKGSGWESPAEGSDDYIALYATAYLEKNYYATTMEISDASTSAAVQSAMGGATEWIKNDDPYGDDSDGSGGFGGSGGDGSRESWDDTITTPDVPSLSIGALGSMGIFTPSTTQLQSFFKYLWSDAFSVDGFKKILSDPMQAIISLHALPCAVDAGASAEVAFGNIATGVSMPRVSSEWVTVDCGSIPFAKYYGSFFDYSPYTRFQIFLPYIGYKDISPDDFVGGSCHVVYHVHVPSGALMCYLLSSAVDNSVLYQYSGSCLMQLPITSGTYNNFVGSLVTGIASGATALGNISSVAGKVASGALSAVASASSAVASLGSVLSSKPTVSRSGSISGASGWMARQVPYVIRTRPNAVLTENLNSFEGYPLYRSRMLSQMSGYTVIEDIHLSGLSATSDEAEEIERLLKEGVIF